VDILTMLQFCGQLAGDNGAGKANKPKKPPAKVTNTVDTVICFQGPEFLIASWLALGADTTAQYYGYVNGWDYQIAAWTQNMIPMTCVISVNFTLLPYSAQTNITPGQSSLSMVPPGLNVKKTIPVKKGSKPLPTPLPPPNKPAKPPKTTPVAPLPPTTFG
jgi:hypothetical protein